SPGMLGHSRHWARQGAGLEVAPADQLPVLDTSLGLLVASLADPYDDDSFWSEVARVLAPDGRCVVTTPSWLWAARFRDDGRPGDRAEFELRDGTQVAVPSMIRTPDDEIRLVERHGLCVLRRSTVSIAGI